MSHLSKSACGRWLFVFIIVTLQITADTDVSVGAPATTPAHRTKGPVHGLPRLKNDVPKGRVPPLPPAPAPLVLPPSASDGPLLTMQQAFDIALRQNPQMQQSALQVKEAVYSERAVGAQALPQTHIVAEAGPTIGSVNIHIPQGALGTLPPLGPVPSRDTTFHQGNLDTLYVAGTIRQPITELGRIALGVKIKKADITIAGEQLRAQRLNILAQVRDAYYGAVQAQVSLQAGQRALFYAQEVERLFTQYEQQRTVLRSYLLDARSQRLQQEHNMLTLHDALAGYKEQLNVLLGRDPSTSFSVVDPGVLPREVDNLPALEARALKERPDIREAALRVAQADWDARAKRSETRPDFGLQLQYLRPFGIDFLPQQIFTVSAVMTWEPLDWGRRRNELLEKLRKADEARLALKNLELAVRVDVRQQYRKLVEALDAIRVADALRQTAEEKLRVSTERFKVKDTLLNDLLKAQADLADAQRQFTQALFSWATARSALSRAIGEE